MENWILQNIAYGWEIMACSHENSLPNRLHGYIKWNIV